MNGQTDFKLGLSGKYEKGQKNVVVFCQLLVYNKNYNTNDWWNNMDAELKNNDFHNVAIFIDYENVHKTLLNSNTNAIREGFFEKLKIWCKDHNRRIVKIVVYCNFDNKDLYESHHQSFLQSYGVETVHTSNQGKNFADLKLAIDVLNSMYTNNNIDEFIIMSNDKDMTPLLNTVRANKRKASILTTGDSYNSVLCEFADEQIKFEDIISSVDNGHLIINDIEQKFLSDIRKYVDGSISLYEENGKQDYKRHYNVDYFSEQQSSYYNVMRYEILNIMNLLYKSGNILFYNHIYRTSNTLAIVPTIHKEYFISNNIIKVEDLCEDDSLIKDMIKESYDSYK